MGVKGGGAYSTVYTAVDLQTDQRCVLKEVRVLNSKDGLPLAFYRESSALGAIDHPYVVHKKGVVRDSITNTMYIVLEYCNLDLDEYIRKRSPAECCLRRFKCFFLQILIALSACHGLGIVHCDLKPRNILVNEDGTIRLADFGLSCFVRTTPGRSNCEVVTPTYRSPELILGAGDPCPAIDIWSLGCIFYELITGHRLFHLRSTSKLDQLQAIVDVMGYPEGKDLDYLRSLPGAELLEDVKPPREQSGLFACLGQIDDQTKMMLAAMLRWNPSDRITADAALKCPVFEGIDPSGVNERIQLYTSGKKRVQTRIRSQRPQMPFLQPIIMESHMPRANKVPVLC